MAKIALLIGVSHYQAGLSPLPGALKDIEAMRRVLQHPDLGNFDEVKTLPNPEPLQMQEAIETLLSDRSKDDLAVLFFSGHGVKDDRGRLYFATRLTRKNSKGELVKATAVPAGFVQDIMSNSRCKRQVIILDCCFSGAFAEGMTAKDDGTVNVQTQLGGEGRVVLTSSTSTQYSFEQQGADLSVYTRYIVEGIETGAADADSDGVISVEELHDYAYRKVQETAPAMQPKIYIVEEGFRIYLAKAAIGEPKLRYRQEVEHFSSQGEISAIGNRALSSLREQLGLSVEETQAIGAQVLRPYRDYQRNLQRYEQLFADAIQREFPLSSQRQSELRRFQEIVALRTEDVSAIEEKWMSSLPQISSESSSPVPIEVPSSNGKIPMFLVGAGVLGAGAIGVFLAVSSLPGRNLSPTPAVSTTSKTTAAIIPKSSLPSSTVPSQPASRSSTPTGKPPSQPHQKTDPSPVSSLPSPVPSPSPSGGWLIILDSYPTLQAAQDKATLAQQLGYQATIYKKGKDFVPTISIGDFSNAEATKQAGLKIVSTTALWNGRGRHLTPRPVTQWCPRGTQREGYYECEGFWGW